MLIEEHSFAVGSQLEGCVIDKAQNGLNIDEEVKGIWRAFDPAAGAERTLLAAAPSRS